MEKESGNNRLTAKIIAFIGSSFAECRGNAKRKEHSAESRSIDFFSHQFSFSVFTAPRSSLLAPCSLLLDDFVCSSQHIRRNRQADLLRGLQVDYKLKFRWLFHRQIGRLGSLQDFVHEVRAAPVAVREVRP